jgi:hypothetical protein
MEHSSHQDNGCCKDEQQQIKLDDDHKLVEGYYTWNFFTPAILISPYYSEVDLAVIPASKGHPVSHSPPLKGKSPTYLLICVFRI